MNINKSVTAAIFTMAFSASANAGDSYRGEVSLTSWNLDGQYYDANMSSLHAGFYFSAVELNDHPLNEAVFLERIGGLSLRGSRADYDYTGPTSPFTSNIKMTSEGVNLAYVRPESPYMVNLNYDTLVGNSQFAESETTTYSIGIGYFLGKSLLTGLQHFKNKTETKLVIAPGSTFNSKIRSTGLFVKYVGKLDNAQAYNLEAGILYDKEYDRWFGAVRSKRVSLSGDYYFTPNVSLGASVHTDGAARTGTIRSTYFFMPRYALNFSFRYSYPNDSAIESSKAYTVGIVSRF